MNKTNPIKMLIFFFIFAALISSCDDFSSTTNPPLSTIEEEQVDDKEAQPEKQTENDKKSSTSEVKPYVGTFFKIEYPSSFKPSPDGPIMTDGNWIRTDEASFTSPDGNVEFFVYSPQWGGTPKDYLILKENEKGVSEKADVKNSNVGSIITTWKTIEDKNKKYTRSIMSQKTESTNLVFRNKIHEPSGL